MKEGRVGVGGSSQFSLFRKTVEVVEEGPENVFLRFGVQVVDFLLFS